MPTAVSPRPARATGGGLLRNLQVSQKLFATATTNEMGRNVGEVSTGSRQISADVAEVADAAAETTTAAADELARIANELKQGPAMFRY
jgi:methyl-accepting chemotaxis protein